MRLATRTLHFAVLNEPYEGSDVLKIKKLIKYIINKEINKVKIHIYRK